MIQGSVAYVRFFQDLPPFIQALIAGIITWLLTALGAAAVLYLKELMIKY